MLTIYDVSVDATNDNEQTIFICSLIYCEEKLSSNKAAEAHHASLLEVLNQIKPKTETEPSYCKYQRVAKSNNYVILSLSKYPHSKRTRTTGDSSDESPPSKRNKV